MRRPIRVAAGVAVDGARQLAKVDRPAREAPRAQAFGIGFGVEAVARGACVGLQRVERPHVRGKRRLGGSQLLVRINELRAQPPCLSEFGSQRSGAPGERRTHGAQKRADTRGRDRRPRLEQHQSRRPPAQRLQRRKQPADFALLVGEPRALLARQDFKPRDSALDSRRAHFTILDAAGERDRVEDAPS